MAALVKEAKQVKSRDDFFKLVNFIRENQGCEMSEIEEGLGMSTKHALSLLARESASSFVSREGKGRKGDPYRYFAKPKPLVPQTGAMPGAVAKMDGVANAQYPN
jgi:hypothetical protein